MMAETPTLLDYIWIVYLAPFMYMIPKHMTLSNKVTKNTTEIENLKKTDKILCERLESIDNKLGSMAKDLNQLIGRFEEHRDP